MFSLFLILFLYIYYYKIIIFNIVVPQTTNWWELFKSALLLSSLIDQLQLNSVLIVTAKPCDL